MSKALRRRSQKLSLSNALAGLFQRVGSFNLLEDGWDGRGTKAPTSYVIGKTRKLLFTLLLSVDIPELVDERVYANTCPATNSEIYAELATEDRCLELILSTDSIYYLQEDQDKEKYTGACAWCNCEKQSELIHWLIE